MLVKPELPESFEPFWAWSTKLTRVLDDFLQQIVSEFQSGVQSGSIVMFAGSVAPEGWVLCDGTEYDRAKFPELFKTIGTTWGSSGPEVFAVPDFRGKLVFGANGSYPLGGAGPASVTGAGNSSVAVNYIIKV